MHLKKRYRLGIDLGTASIGTALIELSGPLEHPEPAGILHMGVRIFDDGRDPKTKEPLAVSRRLARQARRRRDRYLRRRQRIINAFVECGLFPKNEVERKALEILPPYKLRSEALDTQIPLYHLGRALFHLSQRRGFKSSRKSGQSDENGKINSGISRLKEQLGAEHCRTLGEYFFKSRIQNGLSVRARTTGVGANSMYPFYPERSMVSDEFDQLWESQLCFYPSVLKEDARIKIRDILLYQRPLKPVKPGKCTLEPSQERCPIADPLYQRFRILQEVNHLRILLPGQSAQPLHLEQRNLVSNELLRSKEIKLDKVRRLLKLPNEAHFSLESDNRDRIKGDEVATILSGKKYFGPKWQSFSFEEQTEITEQLLTCDEAEPLVRFLQSKGLTDTAAGDLAEQSLPVGYGRLSRMAMEKIIPFLECEVITYDKAAEKAGYKHSEFGTGQVLERLPYYGEVLERHIPRGTGNINDPIEKRIGKIANPTVHIALNQLRHVVNCTIKRFGPPEQVVIELARDLKMGEKQKKEYSSQQKENEKRNERIDHELEKLGQTKGGENRMRYKLWEELGENPLDRICPYSGKPIPISKLFNDELEIEHILPFAMTYDDSLANKTIAYRLANRAKGNRTPHEAFGNSPTIGDMHFEWDEIITRAWNLPRNKSWRFEPEAMERFIEDGDFTARQLVDTAYASKLAREYLTTICDKNKVWSIPGRLTALLRAKWGLNEILGTEKDDGSFQKNRNHHGHHSIDALVVASTDRRLLNKLSSHSTEMLTQGQRALAKIPTPWETLFSDARDRLTRLVVSHRKDHGLGGALHNDTAYGIIDENTVQHRVPLSSLKPSSIDDIKSESLRELLQEVYAQNGDAGWKVALEKFQVRTGIRRARILEKLSTVPIRNNEGNIYKAYKPDGNFCYDIWEEPNGKWNGRVLTRFEANQSQGKMPPRKGPNDQKLLMRLMVDDTVKLNHPTCKYWRVAMISDGVIAMAPIHEGGNLRDRERMSEDHFKYLRKTPNTLKDISCQVVHVDECGFVITPR